MDLDQENFVDVEGFAQSKAILENALDDLSHYLKMFHKGDYDAFPKVKVEEWYNLNYHLKMFNKFIQK